MTQAIINNLNIQATNASKYMTNPTAALQKISSANPAEKDNGILSIFEEIKNKICSDNQDKRIGIDELKDTIKEVTEEANAENALDLTLARDINEIISQLKLATDISAENAELIPDEIAENITDAVSDTDIGGLIATEMDADVSGNLLMSNADNAEINNSSLMNDEKNMEFDDSILMADADLLSDNDTITEEIIKTTSKAITDEAAKAIEEASSETGDLGLDEEALKELNIESLEADTGSSGEAGSQLQEQSANEHVVKVMLNQDSAEFEVKMPQNVNQTTKTEPTAISTNKIIEQITKQLEGLHNSSKLNIVLNPEALGKVSIQITKSPEGMSAQFTVASQEAREILMKGIDGLKDGLLSHGVGVDNVSVKMNETQKSEYNQDWTEQENSNGGNKGQKQQNKEEKEKGLFEQMFAQIDLEKNGNV